jgi:hypothetical protein
MFFGFACAVSSGLSLPICHAPSPNPFFARNEQLDRYEIQTFGGPKVSFAYPNKFQQKIQALPFRNAKYQQFIDPTNIRQHGQPLDRSSALPQMS